ncbi:MULTISPECIES: hypothetical protein [Yersinia pseudotuberculosis complex]|uniref:Uncharacterized protein n=2 Tax=Yersinia pseudotuberculosis TaxID=633 RepID=Q66AA6_YERPS|nr:MULTISPECIES: hypothetical protein [Yersinia pseudotuberculosis complex]AXY32870.1 hypothetical protein CEQ20_05190 [Yersinia pseudotuberculosis]AYW87917.1 hypothetical protein EGX87_12445 [Yersinia pseudotuberculosis]AYW93061.1 hypothetical protein EGX47_18270 [Yersinia pseudotuberculosis]AYW97221.1 hypothetical protein EGX39_16270 [Yersinia pseudotuberculosis]AYW98663.1 hypothetical protein EGX53_01590 [Yersinia pseudotuberculosis]
MLFIYIFATSHRAITGLSYFHCAGYLGAKLQDKPLVNIIFIVNYTEFFPPASFTAKSAPEAHTDMDH